MNVLVLRGGLSSEREVSLRSAQAVVKALRDSDHFVIEYDTADGLEGLSSFSTSIDVVFPVLHGAGGEDGSVQAELEALNLPFVGTDSEISRLCFNKHEFKEAVSKLGVRVPEGELVSKHMYETSNLRHQPFVLKPDDGGSSVDTFICTSPKQLPFDVENVFHRNPHMLLEELIIGTEITVPVLADSALPVVEIIPPEGETFNYQNKYNGRTQELCPPKSVTVERQIQAQKLAERVHQLLGVRHLSRTDMIITAEGELVVLELNTIPGMTAASLFPRSAQVAGISMGELVNRLIELAST